MSIDINKDKKIVQFFDELAVDRDEKILADSIVDYEQRLRQYFITNLLDLDQDDTLVDAGCGDCRDAIYFVQGTGRFPKRYIAVDLSKGMLHEGMKKSYAGTLKLIQSDLTRLPFKDGTADKIICSEVLEHIPDWGSAIKEFSRVLRSKGEIIISTPNVYSMYYPQRRIIEAKDGRKHPYDQWKSYWELKKKLAETGFKITNVNGSCFLPGYLSYRGRTKRIMEKMLNSMERMEKNILGFSPLKYFGYIIIIKAQKRN